MPVSSFERQSKWVNNGWLWFENDENPFNGFSILILIIRRDKIGLRRSYWARCLWLLTHDSAAMRWGSRRCALHRMITDEGGSPLVMMMMIMKRVMIMIHPLTNFLGFASGMVILSMFSGNQHISNFTLIWFEKLKKNLCSLSSVHIPMVASTDCQLMT